MTRRSLTLAFLAPVAALAAGCAAPGNDVRSATPLNAVAIEDTDISKEIMVDLVRRLSSDEFEGRMPGTRGEELTVALLTQQFAEAGLQPGNNGSWVQEVPLVEITGRDYALLRVDGGGQPLSFDYGQDWVGVTYREVDTVNLDDSEMVFVGYGINAPERGWNDYEGIDVRGKTVVILVNDPDYETEGLDGPFGGRAMTYYGRWTYKYEEAAKQGAAAALIVHDTFPASYGWNVVESSWSGPQVYFQTGDGNMDETLVNGWIQKEVARAIFTTAGHDFDTMIAAAGQPGFRAVPLGVTASTSFASDTREFTSQNVIAMLPGSTRPDEYVMHTAHWDHLGRCTPAADGDDICNGAVDNATGTAALVALGEAHADAGPTERTLVFLAVTAEEQGLLGADYYATNPVFPLDRTVGGINIDGLRPASESRDVVPIGYGKSGLDRFLDMALAVDGRRVTPDDRPEAGFFYRSDHFAFAKRGVPMIYAKAGDDLVAGGLAAGQALSEDYNANRYHAAKDEYDASWDWSGIMEDVELYYRVGRLLGDSDDWPKWVEGDEFRAVRDESCRASATGC
jgi:Zn-dependent M28 family amino/carboxypeptidase